jgi:hypothetical protein
MFMKKLNVLMASLLAVAALNFSACSNDPGEAPTVSVTEVAGATYTPGSTISYTVVASTNDELSTLTVTGDIINPNVNYTYDKNLSTETTQVDVPIPATLAAGSVVTFTFTVTTSKTGEFSVTKTFTVMANMPAMMTYSSLSSIGSYTALSKVSGFDVETGTAVAPAGTEDLLLLYNGTAGDMVLSPNSSQAKTLYGVNNVTYNSSTVTKVQKLSGVTYASVDAAALDALTVTAAASGYVTVVKGDVVAFETAGGRKGVLEISSVTYKADAPIGYNVKVQAAATAK